MEGVKHQLFGRQVTALHVLWQVLCQVLALQLIFVQGEACVFNQLWHGRWYQGDLGEVVIREEGISGKGHCIDNKDQYYLLHDKERQCKQCLLMIKKHQNIIQYRSSFCQNNIDDLTELCQTIRIEEPLYTLVREGAPSVPCPFSGRHKFSYKTDTGTCDSPLSQIRPCAGTGKFHFKYSKCNLMESTFKDRNFECLASWKDGSDTYFYGGFSGGVSNHDMYRCFMYEKHGTELRFSMSADASCRGLTSPQEGPIMVTMFDDGWKQPECIFPAWFRRIRWRDLAGKHLYNDNQEPYHTIDVDYQRHLTGRGGHTVTSYRCLRLISHTSKEFVVASLSSHGCNNHYQCLKLKKRNDQVLEVHPGKHELQEPTTCPDDIYDTSKVVTLIPEDMHTTACPFPGRYDVVTSAMTKSSECSTTLQLGCNGSSVISIEDTCEGTDKSDWLECLSHWEEDGKQYMIARTQPMGTHTALANCFVFSSNGQSMSFSTDASCNAGVDPILSSYTSGFMLTPEPAPCPGAKLDASTSNSSPLVYLSFAVLLTCISTHLLR